MQSKHSFARAQTEYFLLQRKSSLVIFHFNSKYCLVVQHRKHGTGTKGDTGIRVTRHCSTLYSVRKMSCIILFFFLPYFYFPYFLSGLSIAYQINPYIKRNLEYVSIQAFHFSSYRIPHFSTRKEIAKQHKYIKARQYYLSFPGRISVFLKVASVELVLYRIIFEIK